ncbi:MAG: ribonuclease R [candidate division Zixibacteria bacterium]|nr:ribonuclease R [candidate division Zixibacteria bacterium]MDH3937151.1 ribonuclease R [candidate division Zixibacteria bacterium]MDH4033403.1 ribonuclease R [candidate division Zixibacteria bacterium]
MYLAHMKFDSKTILNFIREKSYHPMKAKELAKALSIPQPDYRKFRHLLKLLLDSGELVKLKRSRIGLADEMNIATGRFQMTRSGTGFLIREGETEDIMIPPTQVLTAMDGDQVMVRLTGQRGERKAGSVFKVLKRADRNIVGKFCRGENFCTLVPDNARLPRELYIPARESLKARDGEKVVARLTHWANPNLNPEGKVVERIGFPGEPGVDLKTVIRNHNLADEFPDDVLNEAEQAAGRALDEEFERRVDLTKEIIYTIDPEDAKDHDDAINIVRTKTGYTLGVHIADVSFFVKPSSSLDREAFERGNSVYLPGMVVPMLPEVLSNDVCSLKPNRKRLAHTCTMQFDLKGKLLSWKLSDSVIKSRARLSYEEVQALFDGSTDHPPKVKRVVDSLKTARELANLLSKRRFNEGSLDFDLPEAKLILNDSGEVIELGNRVRLEAHRLVEEFMLVANKAVALEVFRRALPFLYRVHDRPSLEKMEEFSAMMSRLGLRFPVSPNIKPVQFARFLDQIKNRPEADFINELMLRSMQKAVYQRSNIGHFGLAFTHYTHFTSPIRRYPDLLVHRLLRQLSNGGYAPAFAKRVPAVIDHASKHCSETERVAEAAERDAIKIKQVQYMSRHVGDEFTGVISGVTSFGFFVRLDKLGVEGMVRISSIDDDYYLFEEQQYRLVGRRTRQVFRMGDSVRVGVMKVDKERHEIDLFPADLSTRKKPAPHGPGGRSKKRKQRR